MRAAIPLILLLSACSTSNVSFWKHASATGDWQLLLDGKGVRVVGDAEGTTVEFEKRTIRFPGFTQYHGRITRSQVELEGEGMSVLINREKLTVKSPNLLISRAMKNIAPGTTLVFRDRDFRVP